MIDARINVGLPAHPKTKKLIKRLGTDSAWRLICLFLWAAQNRPDGDLAGLADEDIELAIDWSGEDGAFVAALVAVGYLDGDEGSYQLHDWKEHNPWANGSGARSEKARWNALCKHHGKKMAAELMPEYAGIYLKSRQQRPHSRHPCILRHHGKLPPNGLPLFARSSRHHPPTKAIKPSPRQQTRC